MAPHSARPIIVAMHGGWRLAGGWPFSRAHAAELTDHSYAAAGHVGARVLATAANKQGPLMAPWY